MSSRGSSRTNLARNAARFGTIAFAVVAIALAIVFPPRRFEVVWGYLAVPAALRFVLGVETEMQQRVYLAVGDQEHVAAPAAVAAARPAAGNVFFPAERETAVAAVPRFDQDARFVDEHRKSRRDGAQPGGQKYEDWFMRLPERGRTFPCARGL